jgi:lipid II:glycine glycyltransferase (peptidoglycan interpeptide bridge formation enzyme)
MSERLANTNTASTKSPIPTKAWRVQLSTELKDAAWDAFLNQVPGGHHVQSSSWAETKAHLGWQVSRVTITEAGVLLAGAQLLEVVKAPFGKVGFISKGPVFAAKDVGLATTLLKALKQHARKRGLRYVLLQAPAESAFMLSQLEQQGFQKTDTSLAPTATLLLDLSQSFEQILANMRKKTRQYINKGSRELSVREGTKADIKTFYTLLGISAERIGFKPFAKSYYEAMWQAFEATGNLKLFLAELKGECVSALMVIGFNDTVVTKTIAWSGLYSKARPNEAVYWAAIQWAKARAYRYCDLEGIHAEAAQSLLQGEDLPEAFANTPTYFKLGFGGQVCQMPGAYDYIANPVLRWGYQRVFPKIKNSPQIAKLFERIRTQNHDE